MKKMQLVMLISSLATLLTTTKAQGLIAQWDLNGNGNNSISTNFTGVELGSPVSATDRKGNLSSCYLFSSSRSQIIKFGDILDTLFSKNNSTFTVTGWANTSSLPDYEGGNYIVSKSFGASGPYQWHVYHDQDGYVKAVATSDIGAVNFAEMGSQTTISTNTWFHFALVFDGNLSGTQKLKLYINGTLGKTIRQGGSLNTYTVNSDQELAIGGGYSPILHQSKVANGYNGYIDDVRIYNTSLSKTEIDKLISVSSSINESTFFKSTSIFPNPTTKHLNFEFDNNFINQIGSIKIINTLGKILYETNEIEENLAINLSDFCKKGFYFVQITNKFNDIISTNKIISNEK